METLPIDSVYEIPTVPLDECWDLYRLYGTGHLRRNASIWKASIEYLLSFNYTMLVIILRDPVIFFCMLALTN